MTTSAQVPTREAILTLLLRRGECSAAELAAEMDLSVQVMRRHLRSLQEADLVEASPTATGPGRPSNRWRLTRHGRSRFPNASETFALDLLDSLATRLPSETFQDLLRQQARDKARLYREHLGSGDLSTRVARLVALRRQEGYLSEASAADDGRSWTIVEMHCSVARIAEQYPLLCDQELHLIRTIFPDCRVERVHWRLEKGHSCGFSLSPRDPG